MSDSSDERIERLEAELATWKVAFRSEASLREATQEKFEQRNQSVGLLLKQIASMRKEHEEERTRLTNNIAIYTAAYRDLRERTQEQLEQLRYFATDIIEAVCAVDVDGDSVGPLSDETVLGMAVHRGLLHSPGRPTPLLTGQPE